MNLRQTLKTLCIACAATFSLGAMAQETEKINQNSGWQFLKKNVTQTALASATGWESVELPHTWNALDGQDGGNNYHRGACWYRKIITLPADAAGKVAYLNFAAANMTTTVYVDGEQIGTHTGGYARFMFDVTAALAGKTEAVVDVKVSNATSIMSPPLGGDFTFFGGITRDLSLDLVPQTHIAPIHTVKPVI